MATWDIKTREKKSTGRIGWSVRSGFGVASMGMAYLVTIALSPLLSSPLDAAPWQAGSGPGEALSETPPATERLVSPALRLVQPGAVNGLDPHLSDTLAGHAVLVNIFESLVEIDARGQIEPGLAEAWEKLDERCWIFHLRPAARFHDGRPVRAEDVVASFERARNHPRSQVTSYVSAIRRVRVVDDGGSVEIDTFHPTPTLLVKISNIRIVPADAPDEIEHPVGTGPYRLLDYLPGHGVSLEVFADYWRGRPAESRVDFFFISDGKKRVEWLLEGKVDLIGKLDVENIPAVEQAEGVEVRRQRSQEIFYVHINAQNPPFDDRRVRCAVDKAIDRPALAEKVLGGRAEAAGQMVGAGSFGFSPEIEATLLDRAGARKALEEVTPGERPTFILYHPRSAGDVAGVLRQDLEAVGFRVALKGLLWHEFFDLLQHAQLPAYLAGWSESTFDAASAFESLVHSADSERGFGDMNFTGYSRKSLDRKIERAAREMESEKRRQMLQEISREVREDCSFLPLVWPLEHYGVSSDIEWTPRLDGLLKAWEMRRLTR